MKKKPTLLLRRIGQASFLLGYLLAYLLFHETLIATISQGGSAEGEQWVRDILGNIIFLLICGFIPAAFFGVAIENYIISSDRIKKTTNVVGLIIVGFCALIFGVVFYFPLQYLLIMVAAF